MSENLFTDKFDSGDDVITVTGGASGIGRAIYKSFASLGADVTITDIDIDTAEGTADTIEDEYGTRALAIETDVSLYDDATEMINTTVETFGSIGVLVNNAGMSTRTSSFLESMPEDWEQSVGVTFFGTLKCTHAALSHMVNQGSGCIINYASDSYKGMIPLLEFPVARKPGTSHLLRTSPRRSVNTVSV